MSAPGDMNGVRNSYADLAEREERPQETNFSSNFNRQVILISGSYDHTIRFWQPDKGYCERIIQNTDSSHVNALAISPTREVFVSAGFQHIRMYELESANSSPIINFEGISKNVTTIGFGKEGNIMYSGGEDCCARIWDVRSRRISCERETQLKSPINHMFLHPNQIEVFIADQSGSLWIWNLQKDRMKRLFVTGDSFVTHMTYCDHNRLLAAIDACGNCYIFRSTSFMPEDMRPPTDAKQGQYSISGYFHRKLMFKAHDKFGLKVIFSPDLTMIATTAADQTIKFWRTADLTLTNPTGTIMMDDPFEYKERISRKYDPSQKLSFRHDMTDLVDENLLNNQSAAFLGAPYFASLFSYGIQQPKPPPCYLKRRRRRKRCNPKNAKTRCCKQFSPDCATCYSYRYNNWQNPFGSARNVFGTGYRRNKETQKNNHHHHSTNYSMYTAYYRSYFDDLSLNIMEHPCDGFSAKDFEEMEQREMELDQKFYELLRAHDLVDSDFDIDFNDLADDSSDDDDDLGETKSLNGYLDMLDVNAEFTRDLLRSVAQSHSASNSRSNSKSRGKGRIDCCCSCDCFTKEKMEEKDKVKEMEEKERKNKGGGEWSFSNKITPIRTLTAPNQKWVWDLAFSADSTYVFTASSDQFVRLWDVRDGSLKCEYAGHGKAVTCLAFYDSMPPDAPN